MKQMKLNDFKVHVFALIVIALVFVVYSMSDASQGINSIKLATRMLAFAGAVLLSVSFLLGPVKAFRSELAKYLKYRKALGLWGAFLIILHFLLAMNFQYKWSFSALFNFSNPFGFPFTVALISFLIFIAMTLTSNPKSMQKLGLRKWKCLHRIGYIALFLGILHALYIPQSVFFSTRHGMFLVLLVAIALLLKAASILKDIKKYPVC
ncbi:MAG: ferric reductase-like transmembrane domain-containing protein [archaeon]